VLEALGVSQERAARALHIDPRTSRRYALDESAVPEIVETLLRLMLKFEIPADEIAAMPGSPQDIVFALMVKHRLRPQDMEALRKERLP